MDSPYNTEGDRDNLSINSFGFSEGYLIPSSEVQDNTMRETFTNMSNDKEYDLLGNNCATTVQKVMKTAGLKTYNDKQKNIECRIIVVWGNQALPGTVHDFV